MGIETAIIAATVAGGIGSAMSQNNAGKQQANAYRAQADYNAKIYEQQASMVLEQKKLQDYQATRQAARTRGSILAHTAGAGFNFGGSPLAIAVDSESQVQLDRAVGNYNADVQHNAYISQANMTRYQGQQQANLAKSQGKSNMFSTLLNTGISAFSVGKF